jgi:elongation factor P
MATTTEIRKGVCITFNHDIYIVVDFLHVKPGKGPAFVRTKLKSVTNGRVVDNTFPSGHQIDVVRVERRNFQYLYKDESGYNFMDNESYEQISLPESAIDNADLMPVDCQIDILFNAKNNEPLTVNLPASVTLEVTYTEPGIKGDTATNTLKPATVETGAEVRVPLFINKGDKIKVNTETRAYLERTK